MGYKLKLKLSLLVVLMDWKVWAETRPENFIGRLCRLVFPRRRVRNHDATVSS